MELMLNISKYLHLKDTGSPSWEAYTLLCPAVEINEIVEYILTLTELGWLVGGGNM